MDEKIPKAIRDLVKALSLAPLAIQVLRVSSNWVGHLISDVHGSKHSAGEGMGIPGIFISLLKEISMIPGVNLTPLPKIVGDLYQTEKIDLRTEVMFVREVLDTGKELLPQLEKQALPIALNELLIRSFYFVRHLAIELNGKNTFAEFMLRNRFLQPFLTCLIGLIPNCASSVVLTETFLVRGITFGSCAAGLCANAGMGFVVLLKNVRKWKRNLALIAAAYFISVAVGLLFNLFPIMA